MSFPCLVHRLHLLPRILFNIVSKALSHCSTKLVTKLYTSSEVNVLCIDSTHTGEKHTIKNSIEGRSFYCFAYHVLFTIISKYTTELVIVIRQKYCILVNLALIWLSVFEFFLPQKFDTVFIRVRKNYILKLPFSVLRKVKSFFRSFYDTLNSADCDIVKEPVSTLNTNDLVAIQERKYGDEYTIWYPHSTAMLFRRRIYSFT